MELIPKSISTNTNSIPEVIMAGSELGLGKAQDGVGRVLIIMKAGSFRILC